MSRFTIPGTTDEHGHGCDRMVGREEPCGRCDLDGSEIKECPDCEEEFCRAHFTDHVCEPTRAAAEVVERIDAGTAGNR